MTNHPNRSRYRYFKVCPRGFSNEVTYYRVPLDKIDEVNREYDGYEDRQFDAGNTDAYCGWTTDKRARAPGVAIDWADRDWW